MCTAPCSMDTGGVWIIERREEDRYPRPVGRSVWSARAQAIITRRRKSGIKRQLYVRSVLRDTFGGTSGACFGVGWLVPPAPPRDPPPRPRASRGLPPRRRRKQRIWRLLFEFSSRSRASAAPQMRSWCRRRLPPNSWLRPRRPPPLPFLRCPACPRCFSQRARLSTRLRGQCVLVAQQGSCSLRTARPPARHPPDSQLLAPRFSSWFWQHLPSMNE
jgi:hypothetical protein